MAVLDQQESNVKHNLKYYVSFYKMDSILENNIRSYNILGINTKNNDDLIYFLDSRSKSSHDQLVILGAIINNIDSIYVPTTNEILILRTTLKLMYKNLLKSLNSTIKITDLMFVSDSPFMFNDIIVDKKLEISEKSLLQLAKVINILADEYVFDNSFEYILGLDVCTMKDLTLICYSALGLHHNVKYCTEILIKCIEKSLVKLPTAEISNCYDNMIKNYHALSDEMISKKLKGIFVKNMPNLKSKVEYLFFGLKRIIGLVSNTNKLSKEITIHGLPKNITSDKLATLLNITGSYDIKIIDSSDNYSAIIILKKDSNLEDLVNNLVISEDVRYFPYVQITDNISNDITQLIEETRNKYNESLNVLQELLEAEISSNIDDIWDLLTNMHEIVIGFPLFVELLPQRKKFKELTKKLIDKLVDIDVKRFDMTADESLHYKKSSLIEKLRLRNSYLI